jgi:hypothetical protein
MVRIIACIKQVVGIARLQTKPTLDTFWDQQVGNFCVIHDTLAGQNFAKAILNNNERNAFRTELNNVFGVFHRRPSFIQLPTMLFNEFCKGITYFDNELIVERPSYHRDASCGSKTDNVSKKFKIKSTDTLAEANRKKAAVRLCYIERLIYDAIYSKILYTQDTRHLVEKQAMDRLHHEYFPTENISIEITYNDVVFPVGLTITTTSYSHNHTIIERYTKPWNTTIVTCEKREDDRFYNKTQEFRGEATWVES